MFIRHRHGSHKELDCLHAVGIDTFSTERSKPFRHFLGGWPDLQLVCLTTVEGAPFFAYFAKGGNHRQPSKLSYKQHRAQRTQERSTPFRGEMGHPPPVSSWGHLTGAPGLSTTPES